MVDHQKKGRQAHQILDEYGFCEIYQEVVGYMVVEVEKDHCQKNFHRI
jgi:hypothetical protein